MVSGVTVTARRTGTKEEGREREGGGESALSNTSLIRAHSQSLLM